MARDSAEVTAMVLRQLQQLNEAIKVNNDHIEQHERNNWNKDSEGYKDLIFRRRCYSIRKQDCLYFLGI